MLQMGLPWMRSASWWMQERYCFYFNVTPCFSFTTTQTAIGRWWKSPHLNIIHSLENSYEKFTQGGRSYSKSNRSMPRIPYMPLYCGLPCSFIKERASHSRYAGWSVGCVDGWPLGDESGARRRWMGFETVLSSHSLSVGDLCSFVPGLTASGALRPVAGSYCHTPPPHKHRCTHTYSASYSQSDVWTVSSVTPPHSPIHC